MTTTAAYLHGSGWADKARGERDTKRARYQAGLAAAFTAAGRGGLEPRLLVLEHTDRALRTGGVRLLAVPPSTPRSSPVGGAEVSCPCCAPMASATARKWGLRVAKKLGAADLLAHENVPGEADEYLDNSRRAETRLASLAARLPSRLDILIGHSVGSIIALELLAHLPSARQPRVLVTTGSPLRYDTVGDRLLPGVATWSRTHRTTPWINAYDPADAVAKGLRLLPGEYGPLTNIEVHNAASAHGGSGYLRHSALARHLSGALAATSRA